jgi:uncharacterized protein (DUF58 family)
VRRCAREGGAGHDLHSLREYQPQDDMRHIDWKATARSRQLFVREFTAEDERRVHVVLDTRLEEESLHDTRTINEEGAGDARTTSNESDVARAPSRAADADARAGNATARMDDATVRFERGVTLAASLIAHFIDERAEVRLTLGAETGGYGAGREHLYASLRRLALVAPDTSSQVMTSDAHAQDSRAKHAPDFWDAIAHASSSADANYVILLTAAAPGTIPAHLWRQSHVIYL